MRIFLIGSLVGAIVGWSASELKAESPAVPIASPAPIKMPLIVLDAGHGGKDLGAVTRWGKLSEKDIALAFARKLREKLLQRGLEVKLTRDADVFVPLDQRIKNSLDWGGSVFVSLHLNQERSKKAEGIDVYAFGHERRRHARRMRHHLPPLPAPPKAARAASADLAASLVGELRKDGFDTEPPDTAAFYVLKNPKIPSVLIELGFLSNPREAERLGDPIYQEKLAGAIARALREYVAGPVDDAGSVAEAPTRR